MVLGGGKEIKNDIIIVVNFKTVSKLQINIIAER